MFALRRAGFHTSAVRAAMTKFNMPAMSPTMTEGTIIKWNKKEGKCDTVAAGDVLLEIETDKAQIDVEAQDDGVLAKILVGDGRRAAVNDLIALLAEEGDDISNIEIPKDEAGAKPSQSNPEENVEGKAKEQTKAQSESRASTAGPAMSHLEIDTSKLAKPLSPAVMNLILSHHIKDPSQIEASGPGGRILKGDVLGYLGIIKKKPAPKPNTDPRPKNIEIRKVASAADKKATVKEAVKPTKTEVERVISIDEIRKLCKVLNDKFGTRLSINDFFIRATDLALKDVPLLKTVQTSDEIFDYLVGSVSSKPRATTPSLVNGVMQVAILLAKSDTAIDSEEYRGGSFSVSNAGFSTGTPSSPVLLSISSVSSPRSSAFHKASNNIDIIDFLSSTPSVTAIPRNPIKAQVESSLRAGSSPRSTVSLKLAVNEKAGKGELAPRLLEKIEYYVNHPELLVM